MKSLKFLFFLLAVTGMTVTWQGCNDDDDDPVPTCTDGVQNGEETGVDCGGPDCPPCLIGIMGEWQSSGDDVAPLLVNLFGTDSIYADFRTDNTYYVEQFDTTGARLVLEGTYTQSESGVGDIWEIVVNQSSPAALTSEGIFEVTGDVMQYEIVQTMPSIGAVPPTPEDGFGSTNGGALGDVNVQVYERIK